MKRRRILSGRAIQATTPLGLADLRLALPVLTTYICGIDRELERIASEQADHIAVLNKHTRAIDALADFELRRQAAKPKAWWRKSLAELLT